MDLGYALWNAVIDAPAGLWRYAPAQNAWGSLMMRMWRMKRYVRRLARCDQGPKDSRLGTVLYDMPMAISYIIYYIFSVLNEARDAACSRTSANPQWFLELFRFQGHSNQRISDASVNLVASLNLFSKVVRMTDSTDLDWITNSGKNICN